MNVVFENESVVWDNDLVRCVVSGGFDNCVFFIDIIGVVVLIVR